MGVKRSKWALDIMWRLWDSHNSCWVRAHGRDIWSRENSVITLRETMIAQGRDPESLTVERVFVKVQ